MKYDQFSLVGGDDNDSTFIFKINLNVKLTNVPDAAACDLSENADDTDIQIE